MTLQDHLDAHYKAHVMGLKPTAPAEAAFAAALQNDPVLKAAAIAHRDQLRTIVGPDIDRLQQRCFISATALQYLERMLNS